MSTSIDERVVSIKFDNTGFQAKVSDTIDALQDLEEQLSFANLKDAAKDIGNHFRSISESADDVDLKNLTEDAPNAIEKRFDALETVLTGIFFRIGTKVEELGAKMFKSLAVDDLMSGWEKYSRITSKTGIILSADETLNIEDATKALEYLTWYTDETSYAMADMVDNIANFMNYGVKLEDAQDIMIGIANATGLSGGNAESATRAMVGFGKAIAQGAMSYGTWQHEIRTSGVANVQLQEKMLENAYKLGRIMKDNQGYYFTKKTQSGKERIDLVAGNIANSDSLNSEILETGRKGWLDRDVMIATLKEYAASMSQFYKLSEETGDSVASLLNQYLKGTDEFNEKFGTTIDEFSAKAFKASQESKTLQDVINATHDAISSRWKDIFTAFLGNYEQAVSLYSGLADWAYDMIVQPFDAVLEVITGTLNSVTKEFEVLDDGTKKFKTFRDIFLEGVNNILDNIYNIITAITEAFNEVFGEEGQTSMGKTIVGFRNLTERLKASEKTLKKIKIAAKAIFSVVKLIFEAVKNVIKILSVTLFPVIKTIGKFAWNIVKKVGNFLFTIFKRVSAFMARIFGIPDIAKEWEKDFSDIEVTIRESESALKNVKKELQKVDEEFSNAQNTVEDFTETYEDVEDVELPSLSTLTDTDLDSYSSAIDDTVKSIDNSTSSITNYNKANTDVKKQMTTVQKAYYNYGKNLVGYSKQLGIFRGTAYSTIKFLSERIGEFNKQVFGENVSKKTIFSRITNNFSDNINKITKISSDKTIKNSLENIFKPLTDKVQSSKIVKNVDKVVSNIKSSIEKIFGINKTSTSYLEKVIGVNKNETITRDTTSVLNKIEQITNNTIKRNESVEESTESLTDTILNSTIALEDATEAADNYNTIIQDTAESIKDTAKDVDDAMEDFSLWDSLTGDNVNSSFSSISDNLETTIGKFEEFLKSYKDVISDVKESTIEFFNDPIGKLSELKDAIADTLGSLTFKDIEESIHNGFSNVKDALGNATSITYDKVKNAFPEVDWDSIEQKATTTAENVKKSWKNTLEYLTPMFDAFKKMIHFDDIKMKVESALDDIKTKMKDVFNIEESMPIRDQITNIFSTIGDKIDEFIDRFGIAKDTFIVYMDNIKNSLKDLWSKDKPLETLATAFKGIINAVKEFFKILFNVKDEEGILGAVDDLDDEKTVTKVTTFISNALKEIGDGIINGIKKLWSYIDPVLTTISDNIGGFLKSLGETLWPIISSIGDKLFSIASGIISNVFPFIVGKISEFIKKIPGFFETAKGMFSSESNETGNWFKEQIHSLIESIFGKDIAFDIYEKYNEIKNKFKKEYTSIKKRFDKIKKNFESFRDLIKNGISGVTTDNLNTIYKFFDGIATKINKVIDTLKHFKDIWNGTFVPDSEAGKNFADTIAKFKESIDGLLTWIKEKFSAFSESFKNGNTTIVAEYWVDMASEALDAIGKLLMSKGVAKIASGIGGIFETIGKGIGSLLPNNDEKFGDAILKVAGAIAILVASLYMLMRLEDLDTAITSMNKLLKVIGGFAVALSVLQKLGDGINNKLLAGNTSGNITASLSLVDLSRSGGSNGVSSIIIGMAFSLILISYAFKKIADIPVENMTAATDNMLKILGLLTGFITVLVIVIGVISVIKNIFEGKSNNSGFKLPLNLKFGDVNFSNIGNVTNQVQQGGNDFVKQLKQIGAVILMIAIAFTAIIVTITKSGASEETIMSVAISIIAILTALIFTTIAITDKLTGNADKLKDFNSNAGEQLSNVFKGLALMCIAVAFAYKMIVKAISGVSPGDAAGAFIVIITLMGVMTAAAAIIVSMISGSEETETGSNDNTKRKGLKKTHKFDKKKTMNAFQGGTGSDMLKIFAGMALFVYVVAAAYKKIAKTISDINPMDAVSAFGILFILIVAMTGMASAILYLAGGGSYGSSMFKDNRRKEPGVNINGVKPDAFDGLKSVLLAMAALSFVLALAYSKIAHSVSEVGAGAATGAFFILALLMATVTGCAIALMYSMKRLSDNKNNYKLEDINDFIKVVTGMGTLAVALAGAYKVVVDAIAGARLVSSTTSSVTDKDGNVTSSTSIDKVENKAAGGAFAILAGLIVLFSAAAALVLNFTQGLNPDSVRSGALMIMSVAASLLIVVFAYEKLVKVLVKFKNYKSQLAFAAGIIVGIIGLLVGSAILLNKFGGPSIALTLGGLALAIVAVSVSMYILAAAIEKIIGIFALLGKSFSDQSDNIGKKLDNIADNLKKWKDKIVEIASTLGQVLGEALGAMFDSFNNSIKSKKEDTSKTVRSIMDVIYEGLKYLVTLLNKDSEKEDGLVQGLINFVSNLLGKLWSKIVEKIQKFSTIWWNIIKAMFDEAMLGILTRIKSSSILTKILGWFGLNVDKSIEKYKKKYDSALKAINDAESGATSFTGAYQDETQESASSSALEFGASLIEEIANSAGPALEELGKKLISNVKDNEKVKENLTTAGKEGGSRFISGFKTNSQELAPSTLVEIANKFISTLNSKTAARSKSVEIGSRLMQNTVEGIKAESDKSSKDTSLSIASSLAEKFTTSNTAIYNKLKTIGKFIVEGYVAGIKENTKNLEDAVQTIADTTVKTITFAMDIHSPSKVMEELGEYTSEGYAQGIENNKSLISDKLTKILKTAKITMDIVQNTIMGALSKTKEPEIIKSLHDIYRKSLKSIIESTNKSIKEHADKLKNTVIETANIQKSAVKDVEDTTIKSVENISKAVKEANEEKLTVVTGSKSENQNESGLEETEKTTDKIALSGNVLVDALAYIYEVLVKIHNVVNKLFSNGTSSIDSVSSSYDKLSTSASKASDAISETNETIEDSDPIEVFKENVLAGNGALETYMNSEIDLSEATEDLVSKYDDYIKSFTDIRKTIKETSDSTDVITDSTLNYSDAIDDSSTSLDDFNSSLNDINLSDIGSSFDVNDIQSQFDSINSGFNIDDIQSQFDSIDYGFDTNDIQSQFDSAMMGTDLNVGDYITNDVTDQNDGPFKKLPSTLDGTNTLKTYNKEEGLHLEKREQNPTKRRKTVNAKSMQTLVQDVLKGIEDYEVLEDKDVIGTNFTAYNNYMLDFLRGQYETLKANGATQEELAKWAKETSDIKVSTSEIKALNAELKKSGEWKNTVKQVDEDTMSTNSDLSNSYADVTNSINMEDESLKQLGLDGDLVSQNMLGDTSSMFDGMDFTGSSLADTLINSFTGNIDSDSTKGKVVSFISGKLKDYLGVATNEESKKEANDTGAKVTENIVDGATSDQVMAESTEKSTNSLYSLFDELHKTSKTSAEKVGSDSSKSLVETMIDKLNKSTGQLKSTMENIGKTMHSVLDNKIKKDIPSIGRNFMEGIREGISNRYNSLKDTVHDIGKAIANWLAEKLQVKSPSRVTMKIGEYVSEGLAIGIQDNASHVAKACGMLSDTIVSSFSDTNASELQSSLSDVISDVIDKSISDDDLEVTITPVVDMNNFDSAMSSARSSLSSYNLAAKAELANSNYTTSKSELDSRDVERLYDIFSKASSTEPSNVTYVQNNYSPKDLSRIDIYRQTRNQINGINGISRNPSDYTRVSKR